MELTEKHLIHNENEAQSLIDDWNSFHYRHSLHLKDFEMFPALVCCYIDDNDYSMSYSAYVYYSITYLDDFDED